MNIIIKPIITEKSMQLAKNGRYSFVVAKSTSKNSIKKTVEKLFKVHVTQVSTIVAKGKTARVGTKRQLAFTPAVKKAILKIKQGEKIDLFEV